jgi:hypothetical protein
MRRTSGAMARPRVAMNSELDAGCPVDLRPLPGIGHFVSLEAPDKLTREIRRLLQAPTAWPSARRVAGRVVTPYCAQRQDPREAAGDQHLADVDQEIEPADHELAGDPGRRRADQQAPDREDPASKPPGDEVGDRQTQNDAAADGEHFFHDTLLRHLGPEPGRAEPSRATLDETPRPVNVSLTAVAPRRADGKPNSGVRPGL